MFLQYIYISLTGKLRLYVDYTEIILIVKKIHLEYSMNQ